MTFLTQVQRGRGAGICRTALLLLAGMVCLVAMQGRSALLESPKRVVNGRMVDLTALFQWWTNHHGARPLSGWVRVTGSITGTNSLGWVIAGKPETAAARAKGNGAGGGNRPEPHQFVLKDPPVQELVDFERLQSQLKQAKGEKANLQRDAAQAKAQEAQVQKSTRGRLRSSATAQLHNVEKTDTNLMKSLDRTISQLSQKLSVYPNPDHYEVNAIALETGTEYNGMPIYDRGMPLK